MSRAGSHRPTLGLRWRLSCAANILTAGGNRPYFTNSLVGEIDGHDWRWRKARHLDADVARDAEGIFVAESDGAVVGYVSTWIDNEAGVGFIPNLAVAASCRGEGIGRKLLLRAIEHFRARGVRVVRIETMAQNDVGRHLYPALGFREVARQVHYCLDLKAE